MRVKITHTMEYEEVPSFVNELLEQCHKKLSRHSSLKFNIFDMEDTVKKILDYRADLALVDQQLEDCLGIVAGYSDVPNVKSHGEFENTKEVDEQTD